MPGFSLAFTTTGTNATQQLAVMLGLGGQNDVPHFFVTVRSDDANNGTIYTGRTNACIPLSGGESEGFYNAKPSELFFNDNGNTGLVIYFDFSGGIRPDAQGVSAYPVT